MVMADPSDLGHGKNNIASVITHVLSCGGKHVFIKYLLLLYYDQLLIWYKLLSVKIIYIIFIYLLLKIMFLLLICTQSYCSTALVIEVYLWVTIKYIRSTGCCSTERLKSNIGLQHSACTHWYCRYWVHPSKIGGSDGFFRGLAGLIRGISQGQSPREILRNSLASPRKTASFPTLLLIFTFQFLSVFPFSKIATVCGA